jgi:hypothetical protein
MRALRLDMSSVTARSWQPSCSHSGFALSLRAQACPAEIVWPSVGSQECPDHDAHVGRELGQHEPAGRAADDVGVVRCHGVFFLEVVAVAPRVVTFGARARTFGRALRAFPFRARFDR